MSDHTKVHIVQRDLHPRTNTVQALSINVHYGDEVEVQATISLKPGALPNDENSIREEVARLGKALIIASQSPARITG
jgi:hypothetical protein